MRTPKVLLKNFPLLYKIAAKLNAHIRLLLRSAANLGQVLWGDRNARSLGHWRNYFSPQPIIGYIGWLGHSNLGDEALYATFKKLFPQFHILAINQPLPVELLLYRSLVRPHRLYKAVFLGGGTLINVHVYMDIFKRGLRDHGPGIVFGTGVRDPAFWAEHRPRTDYAREMADWVSILKDAAFVGVRGPQSAAILNSYGLSECKVIGDPALSLCEPRSSEFSRKGKVGINLGCSGPIWGTQEQVNQFTGELCEHLLDAGWEVEFLPMHPIDLKIALTLKRGFGLEKMTIWREYIDIGRMLDRIQNCDLIIGQRLHSCVLACASGVPAVSLAYRPKCEDFMESMDLLRFSVRTDMLQFDHLVELIESIDRNYADHCKHVVGKAAFYRAIQELAVIKVTEIIS